MKTTAQKTSTKPQGVTVGLATTLALVAVFAGSPAQAGPDDQHFDGPSVGIQAGWESRRINETVLPDTLNTRLSDRRDGTAYGGYVGYDRQFDTFVIGIEGGFNPNGKTLTATIPGGSIALDSKWSANISARAGVTLTPQLLAYGRVGFALNRYEISGFGTDSTVPLASERDTAEGIMFGGGLEYALTKGTSIRAEYRRNELSGSLSSNQILGGITVRF